MPFWLPGLPEDADGALIMWTLTTPQAIVFLLLVAVLVTLGWLLVQWPRNYPRGAWNGEEEEGEEGEEGSFGKEVVGQEDQEGFEISDDRHSRCRAASFNGA
jgi:hypothetical protein